MEPQKVYVNEREEATIVCGSCGKKKTVNAQKFTRSYQTISVKCACGFVFPITFEKRKHYRKMVRIPGQYIVIEGPTDGGLITIRDLSRTGIGFETQSDHRIEVGHIVKIQFVLDDTDNTPITKNAKVINVTGRRIGARYTDTEVSKALAFYLMP